jgi:hypothetical protein
MKDDPEYGIVRHVSGEFHTQEDLCDELDTISWRNFLGCDDDVSDDELDQIFENQLC